MIRTQSNGVFVFKLHCAQVLRNLAPHGSLHVRSTSVLPGPLPICFKFGSFVNIYCTIQHAKYQLCKFSGF